MKLALTVIYLLIAVGLSASVLLQEGKNPYDNSTLMGVNGESFFSKNKANTKEGRRERATAVLAVLFMVMSILVSAYDKIASLF